MASFRIHRIKIDIFQAKGYLTYSCSESSIDIKTKNKNYDMIMWVVKNTNLTA